MAKFSSILLFIIYSATCCTAIYEDQVGKFDWRRSFVGKVKHAEFDNKRVYILTYNNVVASLSLKSNQIAWRQVLEEPPNHQPHLLHLDQELVTITGDGSNYYVRGWETPTGTLSWEWVLNMENPRECFWTIQDDTLAQTIVIPNSHHEINLYNLRKGTLIKTTQIKLAGKCITATPYLVCLKNNQLEWVDVTKEAPDTYSDSVQNILNEAELGSYQIIAIPGHKPSFLLINNQAARLVEIRGRTIEAAQHLLHASAIYADNNIFQLEANLDNPEKLIKVKYFNRDEPQAEKLIEVDYPLGLGGPYIVSGHCKATTCHLLLSSSDNAMTLVRLPEGKVIWTREEALSTIVAAEFFELPVSELDVSIENEFVESDVLAMLSHRLSSQFRQLHSVLLGGQLMANNGLVRDDFGLHKIIVVATGVGKLFGIDTLSGGIVWSYRLPNVKPFNDVTMMLLVQRTARYASLPAQCVLLAQDSPSGNGVIFKFDPISGASARGIEKQGYRIKQAMLLPHEDDNHIKPILLVDSDNSLHVYPENARPIVEKHARDTFIYTIDKAHLIGHQVKAEMSTDKLWEVNFGEADLVAISTRPASERVHSQGRVLPDRSVYYKYVNPNMIALATLRDDPVHKHVLSVYLLDGVTGLMMYSASHKRAKGPVHLVHSENWIAYTFFNERFRRFEMVAAELFEGRLQSNSTAFSSFGVSQLPQTQSQCYILPTHPVSMTVTLTERGITNKFLLVGTSSGSVIEIPWMLLQPRFDDVACGPEDGCTPYMPEIPLPAEAIINYNQTLERIKGITVAPARLESTSHVLVHGLDLFYTRVAPSKTFDVLKEDFDHRLIVLMMSVLIIATYVTKFLASKKAQKQAWK